MSTVGSRPLLAGRASNHCVSLRVLAHRRFDLGPAVTRVARFVLASALLCFGLFLGVLYLLSDFALDARVHLAEAVVDSLVFFCEVFFKASPEVPVVKVQISIVKASHEGARLKPTEPVRGVFA